MSNLEAPRLGMVGEGPGAGWRETIGARVAEVEPGPAVVELEVGRVLHSGRRTGVADCRVTAEADGRLVATATATFFVVLPSGAGSQS